MCTTRIGTALPTAAATLALADPAAARRLLAGRPQLDVGHGAAHQQRPITPEVVDRCDGGLYEGRRGMVNSDRVPIYWRLDVRIQKREVFDTWYFDFYIDRTGEPKEENVPLFVPMIGIRGEF